MGFQLSSFMQKQVLELVRADDWDPESEEARLIPNADGMVLVKHGSKAYLERRNALGIFTIPVTLVSTVGTEKIKMVLCVCSM